MLTASIEELEKTVRANRPHLREAGWNEPEELPDDLEAVLDWYSDNAPKCDDLERPPAEIFRKRITGSNDSGVGSDAIPNAFHRIDPSFFADVLAWEIEFREASSVSRNSRLAQTGVSTVALYLLRPLQQPVVRTACVSLALTEVGRQCKVRAVSR